MNLVENVVVKKDLKISKDRFNAKNATITKICALKFVLLIQT